MSEIKQDYKQTKVGIIPEDWDVVKLGDLSQNGIMNGVFNDPKKVGKGLKLINVVNLYNEPFINYDDLKLLEVSEKEYKKFSALKGDLFFTRSSLKEEGIAHCNLFNIDTNDTVFECHTMRIRPNKEIVNSYYLFRYCQSFYARKILISNSKTTTMTTIDQNGLVSLLVPLPPLKEQEKINRLLMQKIFCILFLKLLVILNHHSL
jgi:type I restriction enzyme S subunit